MALVPKKYVEVSPGQLDRWFLVPPDDEPASVSWGNIADKPDCFIPCPHTHTWSEILYKPTELPPSNHIHLWTDIFGWYWNALKDNDDQPLLDVDGAPLYEPFVTKDNPPVPTRFFENVADMLAVPAWDVDEAVTTNNTQPDGVVSHWTKIASPEFTANGTTVLASDDAYGFYVRFGHPA